MNVTAKITTITVAAAAICGLGAATASAATPGHAPAALSDGGYFGIELDNNTTSPLQIYTYQGNDWDYEYNVNNPRVGTIIPTGQTVALMLYNHAGAVDAVGIKPTAFPGNLGMGIQQDNVGGDREWNVGGGNLNMSVSDSGDGYHVVSITNPSA